MGTAGALTYLTSMATYATKKKKSIGEERRNGKITQCFVK